MRFAVAAVLAIEAARLGATEDPSRHARQAQAAQRIVGMYRQRISRYAGVEDIAGLRDEVDDIERRLRLIGLRAERSEIFRLRRGRVRQRTDLRNTPRHPCAMSTCMTPFDSFHPRRQVSA